MSFALELLDHNTTEPRKSPIYDEEIVNITLTVGELNVIRKALTQKEANNG